jgi:hypothetical protein
MRTGPRIAGGRFRSWRFDRRLGPRGAGASQYPLTVLAGPEAPAHRDRSEADPVKRKSTAASELRD